MPSKTSEPSKTIMSSRWCQYRHSLNEERSYCCRNSSKRGGATPQGGASRSATTAKADVTLAKGRKNENTVKASPLLGVPDQPNLPVLGSVPLFRGCFFRHKSRRKKTHGRPGQQPGATGSQGQPTRATNRHSGKTQTRQDRPHIPPTRAGTRCPRSVGKKLLPFLF